MIWIAILEGLFIAMIVAAAVVAIIHDIKTLRRKKK